MRSRYDKVYPTFRSQLLLLLVTISVGFFTVTSTHAATYYVSVNGGSDSNPGTEAAPFRTIAKGSQRMSGGDTLYIRAGTYDESMWDGQFGFEFTNGTASAYTRYAAYNGERVIIKPPSRSLGNYVVWFSTAARYIEIRGLILDGINATSTGVRFDTNSTGAHAQNNRLIGNEITNGRQGVYGGGGNEIIGNRIHHVRNYGMYTSKDKGIIEGNIIHDNGGYGIHHYQSHEQPSDWIIRNNIFYRNGLGFYHSSDPDKLRYPPAVLISRGKNNQFYNNVVYNNNAGGILVAFGASDTLVANNTVYGNGTYGIQLIKPQPGNAGSKNARVINNISYGNSGAQIDDGGENTTLQNNLTTDPKFVNSASGDFGVQAGSPAIDKGTTLAEVKTDFTGKARPEGAAYDIGAFEGAGSKANVLPGVGDGIPGRNSLIPGLPPVLLGPNGEVCPSGYL